MTCARGTCNKQKLATFCEGCKQKMTCKLLVCTQPWQTDVPTLDEQSEGREVKVSCESNVDREDEDPCGGETQEDPGLSTSPAAEVTPTDIHKRRL